ncbi:Uncharacterised protein [Mycobacteroides abscessus subsp. abscessus]|nr:Uncharacterised protein [Mycobacteroides abscessus subsp. abscessus]
MRFSGPKGPATPLMNIGTIGTRSIPPNSISSGWVNPWSTVILADTVRSTFRLNTPRARSCAASESTES